MKQNVNDMNKEELKEFINENKQEIQEALKIYSNIINDKLRENIL